MADPWGELNAINDPFKQVRRLVNNTVKTITLSFSDVYLKSNCQDFQRFQSINMPISGDVQASLPNFTEQLRRAIDAPLRSDYDAMLKRAREASAVGFQSGLPALLEWSARRAAHRPDRNCTKGISAAFGPAGINATYWYISAAWSLTNCFGYRGITPRGVRNGSGR